MTRNLARVGAVLISILVSACSDQVQPPVANATALQTTVTTGNVVRLDAGASKDPQGRPLFFDWSFVSVPAGSRATLVDANKMLPSFVADMPGDYVVQLVVSNGVVRSPPVTVTVHVSACGFSPPDVTFAGVTGVTGGAMATTLFTALTLPAPVVSDANCAAADTHTFRWTLVSAPAGSSAFLDNPAADRPTFTPDKVGDYQVSVQAVNSLHVASDPAFLTVHVATCGTAPLVAAAVPVTVTKVVDPQLGDQSPVPANPNVGARVTLTAAFTDPNAACGAHVQPLSFEWSIRSKPAGSAAELEFATTATPDFVPDRQGAYEFTVVAKDTLGNNSAPVFFTVRTSACGANAPVPEITRTAPPPAGVISAPPLVSPPPPTTINANAPLTLTASATSADSAPACPARFAPTFSFAWSVVPAEPTQRSGLSTTTGASTVFEGFTPGDYDLRLTATSSNGASASATARVSVLVCGAASPIVVATSNTPAFPMPTQDVTLSATANDADTTCDPTERVAFTWSVFSLPQGSATVLQNPTPDATHPAHFVADVDGTYTFRVVATDSAGLSSAPALVKVRAAPPDAAASTVTTTVNASGPSPIANGVDSVTITTTIRNRFGDTLAGMPVRIDVSGTANSLTPAAVGITDANGVYVATLTTTKAESKTITVTANPGPAQVVLSSHPVVTFIAGPATHFSVTTSALSVTAGDPLSFTATALDAFQNVADGYRGTANFTTNDPQGVVVPTSHAFVATDAGVFSGAVTFKTAGLRTVTATDSVNATITGTSAPVTVNAAAAASFLVSVAPNPVTAGEAASLTVTAKDALGNVATGYRGTANFTSSDAQAVFSATTHTFTALNAGVFTGSVTLKTAGAQTVTATDDVDSAITGFASVTVDPAAAAVFTVAVFPNPVTAGVTASLTVTAKDAFANTATGYRGTANFTSSDAQAVFSPSSHTFTGLDAGVFVGTVTLKTSGPQTVTATDSVTPSITGFTTETVNPAAAATFLVTAPATSTAGDSVSFTATAKDAFGNTATGYLGTANFTSTDARAVFSVTSHTFAAGNAGTFTTSVILKTSGSQSITATDSVTPTITGSASVNVRPAAAATFLVTAPATSTAGDPVSFTTKAKDAFGNIATGYLGTATFTSSDAQAVFSVMSHTFLAGDAGTFTTTVTLKTSGSQTITATDSVSPTISGFATVTVSPAAAATALFTVQPSTTTTNAHITPAVEVTVKDAFTNLVPGASVTMSIGTNPSLGVLTGTLLRTTNTNGVATFADLSINTAGTGYKLRATVSSTPPAVVADSNAFDIVDAPAIASFTGAPANIFAGGAAQLSFAFSNGTASITPGPLSFAASGSTVVSNILATTTFTLTVTNAAGTATTAQAAVTVTGPTGWANLNNLGATSPNTKIAEPFSLAFDPANPSTIFAATLTDGVLTTSTGGQPWSETGFPVSTALGVSVARTGGALSVWVTIDNAGKLYHSTDGASWQEVTGRGLPAPAPITRTTIRLDPSDPLQKTLYVTFSQGGLFRSTDDGATWTKIDLPLTPPDLDDQPTALAIASNGTVFVGTAAGNLFRVSAGTATLLATTDLGGSQVNAITVDSSGTTVIAGHADGLVEFASSPTFAFTTGDLLDGAVASLAFAVDGFSSAGAITGTTYAVTATGTPSGGTVWRSTDLGAAFTDVTPAAIPILTSDYFFVSPHPTDGTTLYVTGQSSGFFKRTFGAP